MGIIFFILYDGKSKGLDEVYFGEEGWKDVGEEGEKESVSPT